MFIILHKSFNIVNYVVKEKLIMVRKNINTTIDEQLYYSLQLLALKLSRKEGKKVPVNELIEEGMRYVLDKYERELKNL